MFCCFQDKQKQWNISCNHVLQQSHLQHVAVREICVSHWLRTLCVQDYEVRRGSCFLYLLRIQPSIPLSEVLSTLLWRQEYYRIWRFSTVQTSAGAHTVSYPIATGNPILVWWRGVEWPRRKTDNSFPSVKNAWNYTCTSPCVTPCCLISHMDYITLPVNVC